MEEAKKIYELALTLPGADVWPFRYIVEDALADMTVHTARFTDLRDDQNAQKVAYALSNFGCVFCHGTP